MKQSFLLKLCQFACIASFFFLLSHSDLVLFYAKKGLYSWAVSVLPVLLPFIILSKMWMYYNIPSLVFRISEKVFPGRQKTSLYIALFLLGLSSGFPIGAVFIQHFYEEHLLSKQEAEGLLPLCSFVSPMFLVGYVHPLTGYEGQKWLWFTAALYFPLFICFILFLKNRKGTARHAAGQSLTKSKKREAAQTSSLRDVWLSSLEIIFTIGIYMMLFTVLLGLALPMPFLQNTAAKILLSGLEITTGTARIARMSGLPDVFRAAALSAALSTGGLCAMAQVYSVVAENGLSMGRYAAVKVICAALSAIMWLLIQLLML